MTVCTKVNYNCIIKKEKKGNRICFALRLLYIMLVVCDCFFCINAWCICWYSASTQALPWLSFPWANKKYQLSLKSYIISDVDWISLLTRQRKMLSSILPLMNVREDLNYNKFKTMWILYWSKWLQKVTNKQIKH